MYALIQDDEIVSYGALPDKVYANDRWYDLRTQDPEIIAESGYVLVVEEPRPNDTETVVHDRWEVEMRDGVPTRYWIPRERTPEEIQAEQDAIAAQVQEEKKQAVLEATVALMETAHEDGNPWVQPTGAHDAYTKDATVTHDNKNWVSLIHANVWEPGVSGWREDAGEGPALWVAPTGAHDAYNIGDRVMHNDQIWESTVDANVWEPGVYGWVLV